MNNSKLDEPTFSEPSVEIIEKLRERESKIVKILGAIDRISSSEEWSTLKSLIFDSHLDKLEKAMKTESEALKLNEAEIYRLQGELKWTRKYADLNKLAGEYKNELIFIRKTITQPTER